MRNSKCKFLETMLICLHPWQTPLLHSRMVGQRDSETVVMGKRRDVVALLCSAQSAINRWIRSECHANVPYLNFQSDSQSHINAARVKHSTLPAKKANSHTHLSTQHAAASSAWLLTKSLTCTSSSCSPFYGPSTHPLYELNE